jgi:hypothetical protein
MTDIKDRRIPESKPSRKSKVRFYACVDAVTVIMLKNKLYLKSKRNKELTEIVAEQLECGKRTAQRYIKEAREAVLEMGGDKKEAALLEEIRDRQYLLHLAFEEKDNKLALEIMKDRARLKALYVEKIEHSGSISLKDVDLKKLTSEQRSILKQKILNKENYEEYLRLIGVI